MKLILHNVKRLAVLVLLVFSTASSGIAAAIHHCILTESPMECCGSASATSPDMCDTTLPPKRVAFTSDFSCHINTVVGGVGIRPAVLKTNDQNSSQKPDVLAITTTVSDVESDFSTHEIAFIKRVLPPPAVKSYILNSTFLI